MSIIEKLIKEVCEKRSASYLVNITIYYNICCICIYSHSLHNIIYNYFSLSLGT